MFFSFLAAIFAGFAGAGIVMLLRLVFKQRIPGWATPIAAGGMMIAATVSSEYNWYNGTVSTLQDGFEVVATREVQNWYRPWTYLRPMTNSFVAVHRGTIQVNEEAPGLRLMSAFVFERWTAPVELPMALDCDNARRADLIDGISFTADGGLMDADWRDVAQDDALLTFACSDTG